MISMTGFGFTEGESDGWSYTIDLKSYNNRYLDMMVNLPPILQPKESLIRDFFQGRISRGRVEFTIRMKESQGSFHLEVNPLAVKNLVQVLVQVRDTAEIGGPIQLSHILSFPEIFKEKNTSDIERLWSIVKGPFENTFEDFHKSRQKEGHRTKVDILNHLQLIEEGRQRIAQRASELEDILKSNLKKRFLELLDEVDENRIHTETAVLLMRYGINEELSRLDSHLISFRDYSEAEIPIGKKLDFLCQEISREINTIGSKTMLAEVQNIVVEMKDAVENIREQLRNVE